jgi:hypothetical protein
MNYRIRGVQMGHGPFQVPDVIVTVAQDSNAHLDSSSYSRIDLAHPSLG